MQGYELFKDFEPLAVFFFHSKLKGWEGGKGGGCESNSYIYIHRKKNAVSDCLGLVFNEYIIAYVHNVCYMTVDTCVMFLNRQPGH